MQYIEQYRFLPILNIKMSFCSFKAHLILKLMLGDKSDDNNLSGGDTLWKDRCPVHDMFVEVEILNWADP